MRAISFGPLVPRIDDETQETLYGRLTAIDLARIEAETGSVMSVVFDGRDITAYFVEADDVDGWAVIAGQRVAGRVRFYLRGTWRRADADI